MSRGVTLASVRLALVAPLMFVPLNRHCSAGPVPATATFKLTDVPATTETLWGSSVKKGGAEGRLKTNVADAEPRTPWPNCAYPSKPKYHRSWSKEAANAAVSPRLVKLLTTAVAPSGTRVRTTEF